MRAKILVVDDERDILRSLENLLESEGYEVTTANNGREALKAIEKDQPDVLLIDFFMPDMSGREVIAEIKKKPAWKGIKIIFITVAEFRGKGKQVLKKLGVSAHITKPIEIELVLKTVKRELGKHGKY